MAARVRCAWVARRSVPVTPPSCTQCRLALNASLREVPHAGRRGATRSATPRAARPATMCWAVSKSDTKARPSSDAQKETAGFRGSVSGYVGPRTPLYPIWTRLPLAAPGRVSGTLVDSDLDESPIGATHVDAADSALGTCPLDGAAIRSGGAPRRRRSRRPWGRSCWWGRGAGRARCR